MYTPLSGVEARRSAYGETENGLEAWQDKVSVIKARYPL